MRVELVLDYVNARASHDGHEGVSKGLVRNTTVNVHTNMQFGMPAQPRSRSQ